MPDPTDIKSVLDGLEPGARVTLRLADGREVEGKLAAAEGGNVQLADRDDVPLDQVDDVITTVVSDGIE